MKGKKGKERMFVSEPRKGGEGMRLNTAEQCKGKTRQGGNRRGWENKERQRHGKQQRGKKERGEKGEALVNQREYVFVQPMLVCEGGAKEGEERGEHDKGRERGKGEECWKIDGNGTERGCVAESES